MIKRIYQKNGTGKGIDLKAGMSLSEDLGFDSIEVLKLVVEIEKKFNITFPNDLLKAETFKTIGSLVESVRILSQAGTSQK
jgi:acyl carrier protein